MSATPDARPSDKTYFGVQVLRALAALLVVVYHSGGLWSERVALQPIRLAFVNNMQAGVDIFFVISGFVMGATVPGLAGLPHKAWVFLRRRLIRIVPLYWFFTTLKIARLKLGPANAHDTIDGWWQVVASYLFIPSPHTGWAPIPLLTVGWTLNFEMMFYILFAIALACEIRPLAFLAPVLGCIAVVGWLERDAAAFSGTPISTLVLEFLFGLIIAQFALRRRLPGQAAGWLLLAAGWVGLLALPTSALGDRAFSWGLPAAAIVLGAVSLESVVGRRCPRWLLELGNASYAIYLAHTFIVSFIWIGLLKLGLRGPGSLVLMVGAALVASSVVGELTHRLVELPILKLLRGKRVRGVSTLPPPEPAAGAAG